MREIHLVYSLKGGSGVSYLSAFLACYKNAIGIDMDYLCPTLSRYQNVKCINEASMVFLENREYDDFCRQTLVKIIRGINNNVSDKYIIDIGNFFVLEFAELLKNKSAIEAIESKGIKIVLHCVVSDRDISFHKKAVSSFREILSLYNNSILTVWENRYFQDTEVGNLKEYVLEKYGKEKCDYKIIDYEGRELRKNLSKYMYLMVPLTPEELKKKCDQFSFLRLKKFFRKWEELLEREVFLF